VKGIILAGGSGSRLAPMTSFVCKQLLPVYDKPLIYYPLSVLMLAEIREILVISTPRDLPLIRDHFREGRELGLSFSYEEQKEPRGIAQALLIAEKFIMNEDVALILGDNIFYAQNLTALLLEERRRLAGATVFAYYVKDPERYGVVEFRENGSVGRIVEKPAQFVSHYAVTGLYFYDSGACKKAARLRPSARGELEITDLNNVYLSEGRLQVRTLSRGTAWLDTGTAESLADASLFIRTIQQRQDLMIGCPEEVAFLKGWISRERFSQNIARYRGSFYGDYLQAVLKRS
jgi:glucose-1-phosphate thymidylyltransferase